MKSLLRSTSMALAALAVIATTTVLNPATAQAEVENPLYQCSLDFKAKGRDIQILLGYSHVTGKGKIRCVDVAGNTENIPVRVTFSTPMLFPRISFAPRVKIKGLATGIGITSGGPRTILGHYLAVDVKAAIGVGAGALVALHGNNGVTINIGIEGVKGLGFAAGATVAEIEEL